MTTNKHWQPAMTQRGISSLDNNWYKLVTTFKPSFKDIIFAQKELGFPPEGYDGPFGVEIEKKAEDHFVTKWFSPSTCD